MPSSPQLQTPRAVLTSLINTLKTAPREGPAPAPNTTTSENPLRSLPQTHRPLLITLHVLFPSVVLPALDLLDRDLVTRVVRDDSKTADPEVDLDLDHPADPADDHPESRQLPHFPDQDVSDRDAGRLTAGPNLCEPAAFYLVRSVASNMSRRRRADADCATISATSEYLVQLDAWTCTCANFAFEAFPASRELEIEIMSADAEDLDKTPRAWSFGGMSLDGMDHGGVPCCKHLLACLLAEHWGSVLGSYVTESRMSRTAIAGTVGDI